MSERRLAVEALRELLDALPPYFGLAVPLRGEEDDFNAAEDRIARAYPAALRALHSLVVADEDGPVT